MAKVQIKICPKCGARNAITELFCNNCQQSFSNITSPQPMAAGAQTPIILNQPQTNPVFPQNPTNPPAPMNQTMYLMPLMDTFLWSQRLMCFWSGVGVCLGCFSAMFLVRTGFGTRAVVFADFISLLITFTLLGFGSYFFARGHHGRPYATFNINFGLLILASIATMFVPMK